MSALDALSFQLYSGRHELLDKLLELLASLGYAQVEPHASLLADAARLKAALAKAGLTMPTAHVGLDQMRKAPRDVARTCRGLGAQVIFVPAPPPEEREQEADGWRRLGQELARINDVVAEEGLAFGWHNHHWEFQRTKDGRTFLDLLFEAAPRLVWEADLAWIVRGGGDPLAELQRFEGRVAAVHVKDLAPSGENPDEDGWADPGHGVMDWRILHPAMVQAGARWFVVEHDKPSDVRRFARRARETVAGWR